MTAGDGRRTAPAAPARSGAGRACETCPVHNKANLVRLGVDMEKWDYVVALAGNPNTGKSTVFNRLTGLRQHTGNWPGKTVGRAEGGYSTGGARYKLIDLPGTYSLLSESRDEEIARDFILFGRPDVTVVVVDATCLERNLNLVLQILEITDRCVLCVNLIDEARRHRLTLDTRALSRDLGIPVIPTAARHGEGIDELLGAIGDVASGEYRCSPRRSRREPEELKKSLGALAKRIETVFPDVPNGRWVAMRLLEGDVRLAGAIRSGELGRIVAVGGGDGKSDAPDPSDTAVTEELLTLAESVRWKVGTSFHDTLMETLYADATQIAHRAVSREGEKPMFDLDRKIDQVLTSRLWGFPIMFLMLAVVLWLTVIGANYPSGLLADLFLGKIHPLLKGAASAIGLPWWLAGALIDGVYLAVAWVVSVMLPPMAIFFPLFTILEDFGYLPRVAFNLDGLFRRASAHGKQALTMSMGFGCNAAGVIAARVIDSPRERLIAIITNNFSLCNGRWPTQILVAVIFIGALAPPRLASLVSAATVVGVAVFGIFMTFVVSWALSRTVLRGEASAFSLELPPYRPPQIVQTLYTSLIDRTIYVLWRAIVFAAPAGLAIWLVSNVTVGGITVAEHLIRFFDPLGAVIGLNGVILLAYVVAIPANEIVIPTVLMLTVLTTKLSGVGSGAGVMFEMSSMEDTGALLRAGGWTLLTAVNLLLFSLLHNPCSTTIYTIYRETKSAKWTWVSVLIPLALGFFVCFVVAQAWLLATGGA